MYIIHVLPYHKGRIGETHRKAVSFEVTGRKDNTINKEHQSKTTWLTEFGISVDKSILSDPSVYTLGVLFSALVESSKLVELLLPDRPILGRSELVVLVTEMASASVMTPMVATVVMALFLFLSIDKCRKTILTL